MKKVNINSTNITIFNEADVADLIESIFSSNKINELMDACDKHNINRTSVVNDVAEIVVHYSSATGVINETKIDSLIQVCIDNIALLSNRTYMGASQPVNKKQKLFEATAYPLIINYWKNKLNISGNDLSDIEKIITAVKTQCFNNKFLTHSFNGALGDMVENGGLDISREMFVDEYKTLSKISQTAYSTGTLYFCELGSGTFSYMHRSPERFWLTIDGGLKREKDEDIKDYAVRNFKALLVKHKDNLTKEEIKQIYDAGMKMIDFYCSTPEVCVAVRKAHDNINTDISVSEELAIKAKRVLTSLPLKVKLKLPRDFIQQINKIENNHEGIEQLSALINQYQSIDADMQKTMEQVKTQITQTAMEEISLNNFSHAGNLDGHKIEGGKLARKDFALAKVVDPILQTQHNQELTIG